MFSDLDLTADHKVTFYDQYNCGRLSDVGLDQLEVHGGANTGLNRS